MSLFKNSTWNFLGFFLPVVVAIPAMGWMARLLGVEQFGLFTLAYAVVGYANIFDMGLSRAVIRAVAINYSSETETRKVIGTASCFVLLLSAIALFLLLVSSDWLVTVLSISEHAQNDAATAFKWLSLAIPPYLLSTIWFSCIEGRGEFYKLNLLKGASGGFIALLPLAAVLYQASLVSAVIGLVLGRVLAMVMAYLWGLGSLKRNAIWVFDIHTLKSLLHFGGWMTLSNIVSPMMVYFDRFFVSSFLGAKSVAFYTAPSEVITRLLIIPMSVAKVLFPKLSARHGDAESQARLAFLFLSIFCTVLAIGIGYFSQDILYLWMGPDYMGEPVTVLQVLLVGFVFNAIASVPYAKIQAAGYSKITALIHLAEVIPYFLCLYLLVIKFSLIGAAVAWSLRVFVDFIVLEFYARKIDGVHAQIAIALP